MVVPLSNDIIYITINRVFVYCCVCARVRQLLYIAVRRFQFVTFDCSLYEFNIGSFVTILFSIPNSIRFQHTRTRMNGNVCAIHVSLKMDYTCAYGVRIDS